MRGRHHTAPRLVHNATRSVFHGERCSSAELVWLKLYSIVLFADRRDILMIFDSDRRGAATLLTGLSPPLRKECCLPQRRGSVRAQLCAVMQAAVLKLKATQAAVSKLSLDVREKVAAKKQARAASKEAKNASATGAAASATAADEGAGSSGEGIRKIQAMNQAARRSARKLRASLSKKGSRCPRGCVALLHTSVAARGARWGPGARVVPGS